MRRTYRIRFVLVYREDVKDNSDEYNGCNETIYKYVWDPEEPHDWAVTSESPLYTPRPMRIWRTKSKGRPLNGSSQNDFLWIDLREVQVTPDSELVGRPDPLIGVRRVQIPFHADR